MASATDAISTGLPAEVFQAEDKAANTDDHARFYSAQFSREPRALVTGGRGEPTMTQVLALQVACNQVGVNGTIWPAGMIRSG